MGVYLVYSSRALIIITTLSVFCTCCVSINRPELPIVLIKVTKFVKVNFIR